MTSLRVAGSTIHTSWVPVLATQSSVPPVPSTNESMAGCLPDRMVPVSLRVAVSMTAIESPRKLLTKAVLPVGSNVTSKGSTPTRKLISSLGSPASPMIEIVFSAVLVTYSSLPSGRTLTPCGVWPTPTFVTSLRAAGSITATMLSAPMLT